MHVFIIAALSADGYIACHDSQVSTSWTSKEDLQFFSQRTKTAQACLMGATTFATIGKPLPGRVIYVLTRNPERFVDFDPTVVRPVTGSISEVIAQIATDGFAELAVCGGSEIYAQSMQANLVDTLYLTYEPVVFGQGTPLFATGVDAQLKLQKTELLNANAVLQTYEVVKKDI